MTNVGRFGPIEVRWPDGPVDEPMRALLGSDATPRGEPMPAAVAGHVVAVRLRRASKPIPEPESAEAFYSGNLRGRIAGDAVVLADGFSRIAVDRSGEVIDITLHDGSLSADPDLWSYALPTALSVAARALGYFQTHGALVTFRGVPTLVLGEAFAGKSTTALALVVSGAEWGADDLCVFSRASTGDVQVWGVPRPFHLRTQTARMFPTVASRGTPVTVRGVSRVDVDPAAAWPGRRMRLPATPRVLVMPRITDQPHSSAHDADPGEVLGELLHASAMIVVDGLGRQQEQMATAAALVDQVRPVVLRLGADGLVDPLAPVRALADLLDQ